MSLQATFQSQTRAVAPVQVAPADVALVHDYLNQCGGAERVVLDLSDIWPEAPIYTSLYRAQSTFPRFQSRDVRTTFIDRLPVDRGFRNLFPLYAPSFRFLGEISAEVVIASSSGWAHMARVHPRALHVVYCHTPARWLYSHEYLAHSIGRTLIRPALPLLRRIDRNAARRADVYVANSRNVQRRILDTYGIKAEHLPPPVHLDRFRPTPRGERLLVVSRLLPYKRVDLVVRAATSLGMGLDVVGTGPMLPALRALAGPTVAFHEAASDETVTELMQSCRGVCVAGEEDFGIVSVEAQAAGKPVIAYAQGGSLETVVGDVSGVFFSAPTEEAVVAAIAAADLLPSEPERIAACAERFSREAFRRGMHAIVDTALQARSGATGRAVQA